MHSLRRQWPLWLALAWGLAVLWAAGPEIPAAVPPVLQDWWNRLVPIIFPSLLAAEILIQVAPKSDTWAAMLRAAASWPIVGAVRLCDRARVDGPTETIYSGLLWANLYNPLVFHRLSSGLMVDASLMAAAAIATMLQKHKSSLRWTILFGPKKFLKWRSAPLDAMNWATILLAELVLARTATLPHWHWIYLVLVDPLPRHHTNNLFTVWLLALNGLVMLVPLLVYAHRIGLSWIHIVRDRLLQSSLATLLYFLALLFLAQLRPISFHIIHHL